MFKIGITTKLPIPVINNSNKIFERNIHVIEDNILTWIESFPIIPVPIPNIINEQKLKEYAKFLDGLILQGGTDINPNFYDENDYYYIKTEQETRDIVELELIKNFLFYNKPILGICRGAQLLNVFEGGNLYQDISFMHDSKSFIHNSESNCRASHFVKWENDALFSDCNSSNKVISVHHQAIKDLGRNIKIEAVSPEDGIIEAVRNMNYSFVYGVQWHPECHNNEHMCSKKILKKFLEFC